MTDPLALHAQKILTEHGETIRFALEKRIEHTEKITENLATEALATTGHDKQAATYLAGIMADQNRRAHEALDALTVYEDAEYERE